MTRSLRALPIAALVLAAGLLAAACGSSDGAGSSTTTESGDPVVVSDAWVRATPGGATMGAAYMTIGSADGDRLVSAAVPTSVAAMTQIHETVTAGSDTTMAGDGGMSGDMSDDTDMSGGMDMAGGSTDTSAMGQMTMREVSGVDIPAGGTATLAPGGFHIMLIDLVAPLTVGETVPITLTFEKAGVVVVDAPVRAS